jgi:hypothetical protein
VRQLVTCTRCQARIDFDTDGNGNLVERVRRCVCPAVLPEPKPKAVRSCAACGREVRTSLALCWDCNDAMQRAGRQKHCLDCNVPVTGARKRCAAHAKEHTRRLGASRTSARDAATRAKISAGMKGNRNWRGKSDD